MISVESISQKKYSIKWMKSFETKNDWIFFQSILYWFKNYWKTKQYFPLVLLKNQIQKHIKTEIDFELKLFFRCISHYFWVYITFQFQKKK